MKNIGKYAFIVFRLVSTLGLGIWFLYTGFSVAMDSVRGSHQYWAGIFSSVLAFVFWLACWQASRNR